MIRRALIGAAIGILATACVAGAVLAALTLTGAIAGAIA